MSAPSSLPTRPAASTRPSGPPPSSRASAAATSPTTRSAPPCSRRGARPHPPPPCPRRHARRRQSRRRRPLPRPSSRHNTTGRLCSSQATCCTCPGASSTRRTQRGCPGTPSTPRRARRLRPQLRAPAAPRRPGPIRRARSAPTPACAAGEHVPPPGLGGPPGALRPARPRIHRAHKFPPSALPLPCGWQPLAEPACGPPLRLRRRRWRSRGASRTQSRSARSSGKGALYPPPTPGTPCRRVSMPQREPGRAPKPPGYPAQDPPGHVRPYGHRARRGRRRLRCRLRQRRRRRRRRRRLVPAAGQQEAAEADRRPNPRRPRLPAFPPRRLPRPLAPPRPRRRLARLRPPPLGRRRGPALRPLPAHAAAAAAAAPIAAVARGSRRRGLLRLPRPPRLPARRAPRARRRASSRCALRHCLAPAPIPAFSSCQPVRPSCRGTVAHSAPSDSHVTTQRHESCDPLRSLQATRARCTTPARTTCGSTWRATRAPWRGRARGRRRRRRRRRRRWRRGRRRTGGGSLCFRRSWAPRWRRW